MALDVRDRAAARERATLLKIWAAAAAGTAIALSLSWQANWKAIASTSLQASGVATAISAAIRR